MLSEPQERCLDADRPRLPALKKDADTPHLRRSTDYATLESRLRRLPILVQPETPRVLVTAVAAGRFVPFVGSGISRNCGSPSWDGFAQRAAQQALDQGLLTRDQHAILVDTNIMHARTALSVIIRRAAVRGVNLDYTSMLHPKDMDYGLLGRRIFAALGRMASTFVTTNYDRWLDYRIVDPGDSDRHLREPMRTVVFDRSTFSPAQLLTDNTVIHLHGRCTNPDSMIISTPQYLEHYRSYRSDAEEENRVPLLLRTLFRDKCVVFMGYGLKELEILEYVMQKGLPPVDATRSLQHFILLPFSAADELQADLITEYFEGFGVGVLPYAVDGDHGRIADVLERLADLLPTPRRTEIEVERELRQLGRDI